MDSSNEVYDLLILVDATASMSSYLTSLQTSLPNIISISALTSSFSRIGLLAYRDYCDTDLLAWSGWMSPKQSDSVPGTQVDLVAASQGIYPSGGGDYPEATKTGLAKAYEVMREHATTIILLYTDAPPHTIVNGTASGYNNHEREQRALAEKGSYGGHGHMFMDWVQASRTLAMKQGSKRAHVFSLLEPSMSRSDGNYYTFLSTLTGGACFYLKNSAPQDISKVTVDILMAWMGVEKVGTEVVDIAAKITKFKNPSGIEDVKKEATKEHKGKSSTEELSIDSAVLKNFMPTKSPPVEDFSQRYKSDVSYKKLVAEHLTKIIEQDVSAISLNPIFGSLWRTVCNDRENEERDNLVNAFGLQIDRISNTDEKERMKNWLAESYDYTAEVQETIDAVPEEKQFPCVYLDPTLMFTKSRDIGGVEDDDNRPITEFSRDELLEIGRSCDYRILRRLGRVLTRLSFANTPAELPMHIAKAEEGIITRIPLALASKEHGRKFWKILLHIIVPGTMLSARPAALLAALTIRLGAQPLLKAADTEMIMWRNKWNNLEVPETWNVSCLSLLLDADRAFAGRKDPNVRGLLRDSDRELFARLVSYKMLELNFRTTLLAKVNWKPEKTMVPIGHLVQCRSCHYPRSVTIMDVKGKCGLCSATDYRTPEERQASIDTRVSMDDKQETNAAWVECSTRTCRAQYVVYHTEGLNVRPKCHYCRLQSSKPDSKRSNDPAPWLECKQCLSRVIFPHEYRHSISTPFKCSACSYGHQTVVDLETTASSLSKENSTVWLLTNKGKKLKEPFGGGSLFKQITQAGTENFCEEVILFPDVQKQTLRLNGKLVQNTPDVIAQLKSWVSGRRTESGTCSLCFSTLRKTDLNPACGRRGCGQSVCRECLRGWYGLNAAGKIINTAALSCPFCRRMPTAKTLHGYGMDIHAVGDLQEAVENSGEWVYAWCVDCARAKKYLERVCAAGAPTELEAWVCEACEQIREETAESEAAELEAEIARIQAEDRRLGYEQRMIGQTVQRARMRIKTEQHKRLITKECPRCKAMTERSSGCGHMTCVCGTHWCWYCGYKSRSGYADDIYSHMTEKHGGWFMNEEEHEGLEQAVGDGVMGCAPYGVHIFANRLT